MALREWHEVASAARRVRVPGEGVRGLFHFLRPRGWWGLRRDTDEGAGPGGPPPPDTPLPYAHLWVSGAWPSPAGAQPGLRRGTDLAAGRGAVGPAAGAGAGAEPPSSPK